MNTSEVGVWLSDFLGTRSLDRPDGRPLYGYRCSDHEFEELREVLRSGRPPRECYRVPVTQAGAALFCLYASEWWRRTHQGGPWKWAGSLAAVGWEGTPFPRLYKVVNEGLRSWHRPLLTVGPNRGFLVTLACEGGLPLHLVTNQGTALRNYLLIVLEEFQLYRHQGFSPEDLAAKASDWLPISLRQDAVYRLCGQIIDEIWRLQKRVGSTRAPVQQLDQVDPRWRDRLPLLLPDEVADALLNPLVVEAVKLAHGGAPGLRMRRTLRAVGDNWVLRGEVVVPASISGSKLAELFCTSASEFPNRFELYTYDESCNRRLLALATQTQRGEQRVFKLEPIVSTGQIERRSTSESTGLCAEASSMSIGPVALPGGTALTDLPWIFVDKDLDQCELSFVGQGSVTTRYAEALVAVPWNTEPAAHQEGDCDLVSEIVAENRAIFRVRGCASFTDNAECVCRIKTAAAEDASPEYRLVGDRLSGLFGDNLVFRGPPSMLAVGADGQLERIAPEQIEWRASGHGPFVWRPQSAEVYGVVDLRLMDASILRYRGHAVIAPKEAEIRLRPSRNNFRKGLVEIVGFEDADITWKTQPGLELHTENVASDGSILIRCEAEDDPPADVSVHLTWSAGRELTLRVPYPSHGSRFITAGGRILTNEDRVAVDRLSGVLATATTIETQRRYFVRGELYADDVRPAQAYRFDIHKPLKEVIPGRFELDLRKLQDSLRSMFAVSGDLDAYVRLTIDAPDGLDGVPRRLLASRFDLSLVPDPSEGAVRLSDEGLRRLGWKDLEALHVEATPLWNPDEIVEIVPVPGPLAPGRWAFAPERRDPGPWMILGRDGDWNRMRPLL